MRESLKLSEFLELIKSTIEMSFGYEGFWVVAELSEWRKSGRHYYGELIEHDGINKYPVAKIRCNCWANNANHILEKFNNISGESLKPDMKVLLKVAVNYHISFGLSLNIIDIDPAFTLGDRQARKLEILEKLSQQGIIDKNRELGLPSDFSSIAVITSKTAAGKGDFFEEADKLRALRLCEFDIYDAKMQGKDCPESVSKAFEKIQAKFDKYDVIVLIRGGGSQADLDWFNNILPAESICNSRLPVMVGIGHERDNTVLDDICAKRFDTPSKVINFIINTVTENAVTANHNYKSIVKIVKNLTRQNSVKLDTVFNNLQSKLNHHLRQLNQMLEHNYKDTVSMSKGLVNLYTQVLNSKYINLVSNSKNLAKDYSRNIDEYYKQSTDISKNFIKHHKQMSENLYKQILSLSIEPTLERGFSVTKSLNNKYVTSQKSALGHSNLEIIYSDGKIQVEVKNGNTK